MKKWLSNIQEAIARKMLLVQVFVMGSAFSAISAAAPDAVAVNAEAGVVSTFITNILEGDVGYLLALVFFFLGVVGFIKTKQWEVMLGAFAIGILVIIVPGALKGFFNV
jgi:hypothetical protein